MERQPSGEGVSKSIVEFIVVLHHDIGIKEARKGRGSRWREGRDFEKYYVISQKRSIITPTALWIEQLKVALSTNFNMELHSLCPKLIVYLKILIQKYPNKVNGTWNYHMLNVEMSKLFSTLHLFSRGIHWQNIGSICPYQNLRIFLRVYKYIHILLLLFY